MKRVLVAVLAVMIFMGVGIGTASAANSLKQGTMGFGVDVSDDFMITGKLFVSNDLAALAGLGIGINGNDADGTDIALLLGIRKYMKMDDFAPFVGGFLEYRDMQGGGPNADIDTKTIRLAAQFGAEYFLHKQFSVEGSIAAGYASIERSNGAVTNKATVLGTQRAGIAFNFYF